MEQSKIMVIFSGNTGNATSPAHSFEERTEIICDKGQEISTLQALQKKTKSAYKKNKGGRSKITYAATMTEIFDISLIDEEPPKL